MSIRTNYYIFLLICLILANKCEKILFQGCYNAIVLFCGLSKYLLPFSICSIVYILNCHGFFPFSSAKESRREEAVTPICLTLAILLGIKFTNVPLSNKAWESTLYEHFEAWFMLLECIFLIFLMLGVSNYFNWTLSVWVTR